MREALNNNPVIQAVALGLLGILVAFLLFTRVVSRDGATGEAPPPNAPIPAAGAEATAAPATADGTAPATADGTTASPADGTTTAPADTSTTPTTPGTEPATAAEPAADPATEAAAAGEFVAGPGLPAEVVKAYADGKVVVLLIVHANGIDDRAVERMVDRLRSRGDTAVFVVPAPKVADYSRITQGVEVSRTPALVVLQPRRLSDGAPVASVSYGFRGPASVEQAVEDSLYEGRRDLPYYPR